MSKRFGEVIGVSCAALLLVGIIGGGAYLGVKAYQGNAATSSGTTTSKTATSDNTSAGTPVTVPGVGASIRLPGGPKFAASAGATLALTATLSPSNVTNKTIIWTVSSANVTLSAAATVSGISVTATLVTVFNDTVTVTAKAEADSSVTASVSLWCSNAASPSLALPYSQDIATTSDGALNGTGKNYSSLSWANALSISSTSNGYAKMTTTPASNPSTSAASSEMITSVSGNWFAMGLEMMGTDTSRNPDLAFSWGVGNAWADVTSHFSAGDSTMTGWTVYAKTDTFSSGDLDGVLLKIKLVLPGLTTSESFSVNDSTNAVQFKGSFTPYVAPTSIGLSGPTSF